MELGFSVSRAGPLSQISVQLLTLDTAVHLATGAYGWWKARERSASFADLIAIDGGHLVSTSSFNLVQYTYNRRQVIKGRPVMFESPLKQFVQHLL
jgi:hypothetical protein